MDEHFAASPVSSTLHTTHDLCPVDQATFFRSVEDGNVHLLQIVLKNRKVDINAYNDQGMSALHLAVYTYETKRTLDVAETLLKHGANICLRASSRPETSKLSIIRRESKNPESGIPMETRKIVLDQKTPLLLALELKSSLYLRGWEYRHWDEMLKLLSEATCNHYADKGIQESIVSLDSVPEVVRQGWDSVFQSGKHDLVQLRAEGMEMTVLKLLLSNASRILKANLESIELFKLNILEIKDTSFNIAKAMIHFLYSGRVEPGFMENRGIDLFLAAHKYGVESLKAQCELQINPTPDNWIKLLTAAVDCNSEVLILKCANSIKDILEKRHESVHMLKKSFSEGCSGPHQLFHGFQKS